MWCRHSDHKITEEHSSIQSPIKSCVIRGVSQNVRSNNAYWFAVVQFPWKSLDSAWFNGFCGLWLSKLVPGPVSWRYKNSRHPSWNPDWWKERDRHDFSSLTNVVWKSRIELKNSVETKTFSLFLEKSQSCKQVNPIYRACLSGNIFWYEEAPWHSNG